MFKDNYLRAMTVKLFKIFKPDPKKGVFRRYPDKECDYSGQPYMIDEFGGTKWIPENQKAFADNSWGNGDGLETVQEFYDRLEGLVRTILGFKHICGFCYKQLTDVEQEENGIYNYNRSEKFDMKRIAGIFNSLKTEEVGQGMFLKKGVDKSNLEMEKVLC